MAAFSREHVIPQPPEIMKEEYSFSVVRKYAEIIYLNLSKIMDGYWTFIFKYTKQFVRVKYLLE